MVSRTVRLARFRNCVRGRRGRATTNQAHTSRHHGFRTLSQASDGRSRTDKELELNAEKTMQSSNTSHNAGAPRGFFTPRTEMRGESWVRTQIVFLKLSIGYSRPMHRPLTLRFDSIFFSERFTHEATPELLPALHTQI
jgi:hypothetical protein